MHEFEISMRLIVIGQELLIALIFLFGSGSRSARISGALLMISVAAHLYTADPILRESVPGLFPLAALFAVAVPYFLWAFAKTLFDSPLPNVFLLTFFVAIGLVVWVAFVAEERISESLFESAFIFSRLTSLVIVINALWLSATGRPDDLLERRRRFRVVFVVLVSLLAIALLIAELVVGSSPTPGWLSMLSVLSIGGMTMGLAIPMLKLSEEFFPLQSQLCRVESRERKTSLSAADRILNEKLVTLMKEGAYRKTSLTITALATQIGYPEHHVRRLINTHLGFRNFSAFLNSYRIDEAKRKLSDPVMARVPVLTIALDLGYGSLGPFNRAFKASTDLTPTAYREQKIGSGVADSK